MPRYKSKHKTEINRYMRAVLSGKEGAGELERCAVQRHKNDLKNAKQLGIFHDEKAADRMIDLMQLQVHTTGEFNGKKFVLLPYQKFMVWCLFGWKRKEDGYRRFSKAFISVGRGNGKSPFAALLMLMLICFDEPKETRAELVLAATERRQTKFVAGEIKRMIKKQPALKKRFKIYQNNIVFTPDESYIEALGKEAKSKDGMNLHAFVADEVHEWRDEHRGVLDKLQTSMGKRRQPLEILITTAGSDQSVIWLEVYESACQVVRGIYSAEHWFVFICQMDQGDDPHDPKVWRKGNPNLGISVKEKYLQNLSEEARHNPAKLNQFLRYHMNVRVRSSIKAVDLELWAAGKTELPDLTGKVCCAGLDLGWTDDLASLALCFPLHSKQEKPRYAIKQWSWICEETEVRDLSSQPWAGWIKSGKLIVTPGNTTDPQAIYNKIAEIRKLYQLRTVALDPNNARAVGIALANDMGIDVFDFFQTTRKYNEPVQTFLTLLKNGNLLHDGDPVLSWAADNMVLKEDAAGLVMPDKNKSTEKIDPMVASLMALSECLYLDTDRNGYNSHEFRIL